MSDFEQICVAVPVSGAVIAVRDLAGLLCTVSFGNALAVGSRLPTDSSFTKQCIETGEVVLCDDTESDPRIHLSVAARGNFRSAVAVPIQVQGAVVALIEVFSSQPFGIYPTTIAGLKGVAKSFAALMIFDASNGGQSIVGGSLNRPTILPNPIAKEEPTSVDQEEPAPVAEEQTIPIADSRTAVEHENQEEIRPTVATASQLLSDRPTPIRVWIIAGVFLFFLSLLLLFLFRSTSGN
jgi:GAF domain-containing protein